MKLIQQISLEFREGTSDKVYEVDLCEVGSGKYVVNFRYGRRGSNLKEGTKTTSPVPLADAEAIYDKLVLSKTSKGYKEAGSSAPSPQVASSPPVTSEPVSSHADPRAQGVIQRITDGKKSNSTWKLSRAVWRAGEMRLSEVEPLLLKLINKKDEMLNYSIVWTLGQCGTSACVDTLKALEEERNRPDSLRRIIAVALLQILEGAEREKYLEKWLKQLPKSVRDLVAEGPTSSLRKAVEEQLEGAKPDKFAILDILYLINNEHARAVVMHFLRKVPFQPNWFQRVRHIFKAAEMRRDTEVYGLIAYRFEKTSANFTMPSWYGYGRWKREKPTLGDNASRAYSSQTRFYLRRRVWWTLRRMAELGDANGYAKMAVDVLLCFTDEDAKAPRTTTLYDWSNYNWRSGRGPRQITSHYDRYADYWAFNQILYGNSSRYAPDKGRRFFCCAGSFRPGGNEPKRREESFPQLWDQQPESLLHLLQHSACEPVHRFASKALLANKDYCEQLPLSTLLQLLQAPYEVTAEMAFELARDRYDPKNPDVELLIALANCAFEPARQQAHQWIKEQQKVLFQSTDFIFAIASSSFADTREFARDALKKAKLSEADAQVVVGRLIALIQFLGSEESERVTDVAQTLLDAFGEQLKKVGAEVIRDLLSHSSLEIQKFGGNVLLAHETLAQEPPADLIEALLNADHPDVRAIGAGIISQLPDNVLKNSLDLLVRLTRSEHDEVRDTVRPTIARLADSSPTFGQRMAEMLIDALLVPGAPKGVPSHTAKVLREDLAQHLKKIPADMVWKLLQSRSEPAQEIGGILLGSNVKAKDLSVAEMARLSHHDILSVREAAREMCNQSVKRLQAEPEIAVQLLDAKWEDSRAFAFDFFRRHFTKEGLLPPEVLISICDSIRPEVQQFGRELITRLFKAEQGVEYVVKLSEHPTEPMQMFASTFLEEHAADNPERLQQMAPYFLSVLCRVNKGRVAKQRVFGFLEMESKKSEEAAKVVSEILARQSATMAIGDKARAIEIMVSIQHRYPSIPLPIRVHPVEVRNGV